MNSSHSLLNDLQSNDLLTRIKACSAAGAAGDTAALPVLKNHIVATSEKDREDVCVAIRAIGRIVGKSMRNSKTKNLESYYEFLLSELDTASGAYCSSIIFAICLVGPSMASERSLDLVANAVFRNDVDKMRYRAYQYVSLVRPERLGEDPWRRFIPPTPSLRYEWDISRILNEY